MQPCAWSSLPKEKPGQGAADTHSFLLSPVETGTLWLLLVYCSRDAHTHEAGALSHLWIPAAGMTRSWGLAYSLARGLPFKASPIPQSQQHPQDRDDRERAATFSELAHVPPTHSMSHSMSNGSIPHSPTHSFPYFGTQQALSEHLVCIRPYFGYHGRCNCQISDMTSGGSQSSEDMKDKQTAEPQWGK